MKKYLPLLVAGIMAFAMVSGADAAKRFGTGMSFGRAAPTQVAPKAAPAKSPTQSPSSTAQQQKAAPATGAAAAAKTASPMRGLLMGAATALGIAALAHWLGIGEELTSIIMLMLVFFAGYALIKLIAGRRRPVRAVSSPYAQSTGTAPSWNPEPAARSNTFSFQGTGNTGSVLEEFQNQGAVSSIPAGFDKEGFLSECKANFKKLQEAWMTGNVLQLGEFCTDEVFTVLTHQLRERRGERLRITVLNLEADLEGIVEEAGERVAVVRFKGAVEVAGNTVEIEDVDEAWVLTKPAGDASQGWLLAGIQQAGEA